jgi:hypothetical protein
MNDGDDDGERLLTELERDALMPPLRNGETRTCA